MNLLSVFVLFQFLKGRSGLLGRVGASPALRHELREFGLFSTISKVLVIIFEDIFFTFDGYFRAKYDVEMGEQDPDALRCDLAEKADFIMRNLKHHFDAKFIFTGGSLRSRFPLRPKEESLLDPVIAGLTGELQTDYNLILTQVARSRMTSTELRLFLNVMLGTTRHAHVFAAPTLSTQPATDWSSAIGNSLITPSESREPGFDAVIDKGGRLHVGSKKAHTGATPDKTPALPTARVQLAGGSRE